MKASACLKAINADSAIFVARDLFVFKNRLFVQFFPFEMTLLSGLLSVQKVCKSKTLVETQEKPTWARKYLMTYLFCSPLLLPRT